MLRIAMHAASEFKPLLAAHGNARSASTYLAPRNESRDADQRGGGLSRESERLDGSAGGEV
jgi:hypothetical protein